MSYEFQVVRVAFRPWVPFGASGLGLAVAGLVACGMGGADMLTDFLLDFGRG